MILITGCPRSGTTYYAATAQRMGLDIRHEHMGADGIVSWQMAVWPWVERPPWHGGVPDNFKPDRVIHLVRDPLACISSLTTLKSWPWVDRCGGVRLPYDAAKRAAKFWISWNQLIHRNWGPDEVVWISSLPSDSSVERNARQHGIVTWYDIGDELADKVRRTASDLGWVGDGDDG